MSARARFLAELKNNVYSSCPPLKSSRSTQSSRVPVPDSPEDVSGRRADKQQGVPIKAVPSSRRAKYMLKNSKQPMCTTISVKQKCEPVNLERQVEEQNYICRCGIQARRREKDDVKRQCSIGEHDLQKRKREIIPEDFEFEVAGVKRRMIGTNAEQSDNDLKFLLSLLPRVSKIPEDLKIRFRRRISDVLQEFSPTQN